MATGFKLPDGRDLSDIFTAGDAGITVGFQTSNGTDLGRQFMSGSTGVVTGFRDPSGVDLGSRFGNDPWIAQGYTKATMLVGSYSYEDNNGGGDTATYWDVTNYGFAYGFPSHTSTYFGAISDTSLIGTSRGKSYCFAEYYYSYGKNYYVRFTSSGSKQTSVVINGVVYPKGRTYSNAEAAYNYLKAHAGQNITIYLK